MWNDNTAVKLQSLIYEFYKGQTPVLLQTDRYNDEIKQEVHVLNLQRDLVMRFIHIDLMTCSTSKVDRLKVHTHVVQLQVYLLFFHM